MYSQIRNISLVLVLVLCLVTKVANADFSFGEPVNLGPPFNTSSHDLNFFLSTDGLEMYISSDRSGGLGYIDMWRSTRENTDNPWGPLVNVQEINSRYNEVFPCLSADGLTLYFSDFYDWIDAGDRPGGVGHHDLWMCTRLNTDDPWGPPDNMGAIINSPNAEVSPSVSQDGRILIFASNRSGGRGHYDLWMSTWPAAEGDWAAPVNLGPAVNSSAFDAEACLSTDGLALFFCSERPGGMGSYDLWLTTRPSQAAAWSPPVNLGPAINTSGLERMPSLSPDQKTLYFVSDKPGGIGGGDLYEVPIVPIIDFNGDGIVDSGDMCITVDHWGTDNSLCDIGPAPWGDGVVDVEDLRVLAGHLFEEVADPTLIAHWPLDEAQGVIAYNNVTDCDGTLMGGPVWQPDDGVVAGALQFDGIDDYISIDPVLNPAEGLFSIVAWFKGGAPGQAVLSQADGSSWLCLDSVEACLMTELKASGRSSGAPLFSEAIITDGNWHRIGFVWDGSCRHLYVDGLEVAKDVAPLSSLEDAYGGLYFGVGSTLGPATFFSGLIDDVRVYNRAVSP